MKIPQYEFPIANAQARYDRARKVAEAARLMGDYGVRVDLRRAAWHRAHSLRRAAYFQNKFLSLTGLNRDALGLKGSGQTTAVRDWFWREHGAPILHKHKRTKAPQFNAATLIEYATDYADSDFGPAAACLYGLRAAKTAHRFANAYTEVAHRHSSRIHFGFNTLGTKGERWSASAEYAWQTEDLSWTEYRLNAQNVPSKNPVFVFDGLEMPVALSMRDIFIPDTGCLFWKADYSGLEAELIACITGAKNLLAWLSVKKPDIHMEHARRFFPKDVLATSRKGDSDRIDVLRECCKPMTYGFSYQVRSDHGGDQYPEVYKTIKKSIPKITQSAVQAWAKQFFKLHPEILQFQQSIKKSIAETGKVELDLNQAFLYLPNSQRGWQQAVNFHMQSSGGFLINRAICNIVERIGPLLWSLKGASLPLLQVHDELAGQVHESEVDTFSAMVSEEMSRPATFPHVTKGIPCQVLVGPNWANCR